MRSLKDGLWFGVSAAGRYSLSYDIARNKRGSHLIISAGQGAKVQFPPYGDIGAR